MSSQAMTTIELAVIALSHRDPLSSLKPRRHPVCRLFGPELHPPLARPQLEALRRYAILRRFYGDRLPDAERERIRSAGYDPGQIDALVAATQPADRSRVQ